MIEGWKNFGVFRFVLGVLFFVCRATRPSNMISQMVVAWPREVENSHGNASHIRRVRRVFNLSGDVHGHTVSFCSSLGYGPFCLFHDLRHIWMVPPKKCRKKFGHATPRKPRACTMSFDGDDLQKKLSVIGKFPQPAVCMGRL